MSYVVIKAAIKSQEFGTYLSITGNGTAVGTVTTTTTINASSTLYIELYSTGIYAIRASNAPGVYLRFDASPLEETKTPLASGGGTVNTAYYASGFPGAGNYESFHFQTLADGTTAIESVNFPQCYLRISSTDVNGQYYLPGVQPANYEVFSILLLN
ncbi:uncharacterized protein K444DRAFT_660778 [Hyaloscypha bicolor E]|uniref:Uncharacterized protein n=1 Tax=Hyaloscypha bicolor E TaxID=1095630 RepID=A0A2J6TLD0_9HELO|nr:uncharacterized protein K444DRAFT_660778 [Hyaloscypha bicolor E]PMD63843.1 hypothetical protein K444DRAFT_660778 [Hyaloscypha bicolor E]